MVSHSVRKKCRDCKKMRAGTPGRLEWCDDCGGELTPVRYGPRKKARRAR